MSLTCDAAANGKGLGKGWANPGDIQTVGNCPEGGLLTLAHASPDMARHRQAGKKEASVNQHGGWDLPEGKHQEGEVKGTFQHIKTQVFAVLS